MGDIHGSVVQRGSAPRGRGLRFVCALLVLSVTLSGLGDAVPVSSHISEAPLPDPATQVRWQRAEGQGDASTFCTTLEVIRLSGIDRCTHGPDPAPGNLDEDQPVRPLSLENVAAERSAVTCDGDGQSGFRVQVLYVRATDVLSRYDRYLPSIRAWTTDVDMIFKASAGDAGGSRSLRFVHDAICQPVVTEVVVSPAGDGAFGTTITELQNQGYTRTDRIYLAFVDTTAAGICGIGTMWNDDRADANVNWNNVGPSYARVDRGCWSGMVAAHELMHNLGGVQHSAPNSSRGGHCIDEYDIMCYADAGAGGPQMRVDCNNRSFNMTRFDCGHNDYFHPNPAPGSYLAQYWNPANNRFLINAAPPLPLPPAAPVPSVDDTKKDKHDKKDKNKKGKGKKNRR